MADQHILQNLLSPPVLFFFLGVAAALVRSDLEIPQPLPKFFSLYLLLAIGFKGGVELNHSGLEWEERANLVGVGRLLHKATLLQHIKGICHRSLCRIGAPLGSREGLVLCRARQRVLRAVRAPPMARFHDLRFGPG